MYQMGDLGGAQSVREEGPYVRFFFLNHAFHSSNG